MGETTSIATDLFDIGCVKFGQFKLKSGLMSPIYIDLRLLVTHPSVLRKVAQAMAAKIAASGLKFDRLAAIPYAGLPIGVAVALETDGHVLYERVALSANRWHSEGPGACGLVVGATAPAELERIRAISPDLPFLIPGVGAQGGDLEAAVKWGTTRNGVGPVINASRAVIYASRTVDFAEDARKAALNIVEQMRKIQDGQAA